MLRPANISTYLINKLRHPPQNWLENEKDAMIIEKGDF